MFLCFLQLVLTFTSHYIVMVKGLLIEVVWEWEYTMQKWSENGLGLLTSMFERSTSFMLLSEKVSMCLGQPSPVASTEMSSYLLKLMPVLAPPNSSLCRRKKNTTG